MPDRVRFRFRAHGLQLAFGGAGDRADVAGVELPGPLVVRALAQLVAHVELVNALRVPRRPLARVLIRPSTIDRPRRRLAGVAGRKLRGLP